MTEPDVFPATEAGDSAAIAAVSEVIQQGRALGLTWTLRIATVATVTPLAIVYDGDTEVVNAVSMQGTLSPGLRVFVIGVPPNGNFVVGFAGSGIPYRATHIVTSAVPSFSFTGIPTSLQALEVYWTARSTAAVIAANLRCQVNGDTSTVYNNNFTQQNNTTLTGNVLSGATFWQIGVIGGGSAVANNFGSGHIVIPGWNKPHPNLNHQHTSHFYEAAATSWYESGGGLYFAGGSYTQLSFFCDAGNLETNSQFFLIGWP